MAKIKNRKKLIAITTAALLVAGGGSAAFAYWTSTGVAEGSATTGTSVAFEIVKTTTTGGALSPNGPTQTHHFSVKNVGTGTQNLAYVNVSVKPGWEETRFATALDASCTADDYTVSPATIATGQIAANATVNGSFTVQMINTGENQDACKGADVPLVITAG
ncbi:hypothetical protein [Mycetocola sp.]|uniref:hypothetical protein n=1 Tax=Mycetocola sp. TaxID=1871042 RepID=UPI00398A4E4E